MLSRHKERPWTVCSDGYELAEEKDLNALPATVKCYFGNGQENACKWQHFQYTCSPLAAGRALGFSLW